MNEKIPRLLGFGLVAVAAAFIFAPTAAAAARPYVRRGMKAAVKAYVKGQEAVAEFQELAEDAYAEAWAELKAEAADMDEMDEATEADSAAEETVGEPKKKR